MNGLQLEKEYREKTSGKLSNLKVSVKDCICVKDMETTASSAILKGYLPPYSATAVQKLLDEGATIIGKTIQDEFGFGSFCVNVGKGLTPPKNPNDETRVCGGSSGGSAALTKQLDENHISLAESTGGSIVCPASYCGIVGLCPTYGRVSRFGLLDYANSLDKIGPMAKTVVQCAQILQIIAGYDEKDATSLNEPVPNYSEVLGKGIQGKKIGIIKESLEGISNEVKTSFLEAVEELKKKGATIEEISLPKTFSYGIETYYIIAMSEASTNLSKYCGMRYGAHLPLEDAYNSHFSKVRSEYFGEEVKRRILLGTFARMSGFRDAFYIKAAKVRTLIINEYQEAFKSVEVLISPTMPTPAPTFEEVKTLTPIKHYWNDILTVGPNLAGLPHISIPIGSGLPKGFMIVGNHLQEEKILQVAYELHK